LFFSRGNQGDANVWIGLQKHVISAALGRREQSSFHKNLNESLKMSC